MCYTSCGFPYPRSRRLVNYLSCARGTCEVNSTVTTILKVFVAATRPSVWRQAPGSARRQIYITVFGRYQVDMATMIFRPSSFVGIGGLILGALKSSYRIPLQASVGTHLMSTWSKNTGITKHLWACIVLRTRNTSKNRPGQVRCLWLLKSQSKAQGNHSWPKNWKKQFITF